MSRKESAKPNDDTLFHKFSELFNKHLYGEFNWDFKFILQMSGEDKVEFDQTKLKELFLSAYNNRMELEGELVVPAILPGDRLKEKLLSHEERHTVLDHVGRSFNLAVKELRIVPQKIQKHPGGRPTEQAVEDRRKFNPRRCGGKELCIVVSYSKDGNRDVKKLAMALTHKAHVQYRGNRYSYETPLDWYENSRKGFNRHTHRLRKKAEEKGWWKDIPEDYHLKYTRR